MLQYLCIISNSTYSDHIKFAQHQFYTTRMSVFPNILKTAIISIFKVNCTHEAEDLYCIRRPL
jgi:hypothetical protein